MKKILLFGFASLAMACGSSTGGGDTPAGDTGVGGDTASGDTRGGDSASPKDTGFALDTAPSDDTGSTTTDTGTTKDSGKADTGSATDTGVADSGSVDTGTVADSGTADTGSAVDTATADTGSAVDTAVDDTATAVDTAIDTAVDGDGGPATENTVGQLCSVDTDCDPLGTGANRCTSTDPLSSKGTLEPSAVCVGLSCDPGAGTTVVPCDNSLGVCLQTGTPGSGVCLPACSFDNSTTAPGGCNGTNVCNAYGWATGTGGAVTGIGFCFGGCATDADCGSGDKCQVESGFCVKAPVTYALSVGAACTVAASGTAAGCECFGSRTSGNGYCSTFCRVGDTTTCAAFGSYVCSAALPSATFTSTPAGMAGNCLKTCATDADCVGGTTCTSTPEGMVCIPPP